MFQQTKTTKRVKHMK